jgi:DNA-binding FadR family transcriptional regulator
MFREVNTLWMSAGGDVRDTTGGPPAEAPFADFDREHHAIARAICDRRPADAEAAMAAHLQRSREQFAALLAQILASPAHAGRDGSGAAGNTS